MTSGTRIMQLITKYCRHTINEAELQELEQWRMASPEHQRMFEAYQAKMTSANYVFQFSKDASEEEWSLLKLYSSKELRRQALTKRIRLVSAAAIVMIVFSGILFVHHEPGNQNKPLYAEVNSDRTNKHVIIQLANGKAMPVAAIDKNILLKQGDCSLRVVNDDTIQYYLTGTGSFRSFNTISTPCGRRYTVLLPDGSTVTLNGTSSIRFSVSYSPQYRTVHLRGQAYFEVISALSNKGKIPFRVLVETSTGLGQSVTVMGTKFDIDAYDDKSAIATSLVEGHIKVERGGRSVDMKSGELLRWSKTAKLVNMKARVKEATAWRYGLFLYTDEPAENVLREINRWYGVSININVEPEKRITMMAWRSDEYLTVLESILEVIDIPKQDKDSIIRWAKKHQAK